MRASRAKVAALHDTATTTGTRSRRAGAPAPRRPGAADRTRPRRRLQLLRDQRTAEQVARLGLDRLEARGLFARLLAAPRSRRRRRPPHDARAFGEPQRERTDAAEQIGDRLGVADMLATSRASTASPSAVACRNAPGGSATGALPIATVGAARCTIISPWRVSRASRCVSASRASAPCAPAAGRSRARRHRARHRSPSPGCRAASPAAQRLGKRPRGGNRAVQRWRQHRASVDRDDVVRAQAAKPTSSTSCALRRA